VLRGDFDVGLGALHVVGGVRDFADDRPVVIQNLDQDILVWRGEDEVHAESVVELVLRVGGRICLANKVGKIDCMRGDVFGREGGDDGI